MSVARPVGGARAGQIESSGEDLTGQLHNPSDRLRELLAMVADRF